MADSGRRVFAAFKYRLFKSVLTLITWKSKYVNYNISCSCRVVAQRVIRNLYKFISILKWCDTWEKIPDFCSKCSNSWKLLRSQATCCAVSDAAVANYFVRWQRRRDYSTGSKLLLFAEMGNDAEKRKLFTRGNIGWYYPWFLLEIFRSPRKFRHYLLGHHVCEKFGYVVDLCDLLL